MTTEQRDAHDAIVKRLMDDGRLIEAGWIGLRLMAVPPNASETQISEMRRAFFAGAQHLFASIMSGLDDDREPTATDLRRISLIAFELDAWRAEVARDAADKPNA